MHLRQDGGADNSALRAAKAIRQIQGLPVEPKRSCDEIWELLCAYCDGEASRDEVLRVEAHLHDCPECRVAAHLLRQTSQVLRSEELVGPPPDLRERILAATVLQPRRHRNWRWPWYLPALRPVPLPLLAGIGIAAILGMVVVPKGSAPTFKVFGGAIQPEIAARSAASAALPAPAPAPPTTREAKAPVLKSPPKRHMILASSTPNRSVPPVLIASPRSVPMWTPRPHTPSIPPQEVPAAQQVASNPVVPTHDVPVPSGDTPPAPRPSTPVDAHPSATVEPQPAVSEAHIQIAAGDTVNAQAYASLAGIKRTLQPRKDMAWTLADGDAEERRVLTVDLYRSRF
ncbi:MAG: zf-HC2 domain-containing protein [Chthonomonadales bacterium]